jgi:hypothetical protein
MDINELYKDYPFNIFEMIQELSAGEFSAFMESNSEAQEHIRIVS